MELLGCHGQASAFNAGWMILKPSCGHFEKMVSMVEWYLWPKKCKRPGVPDAESLQNKSVPEVATCVGGKFKEFNKTHGWGHMMSPKPEWITFPHDYHDDGRGANHFSHHTCVGLSVYRN